MKISIIIPVYNAEKTIENCIMSILNQSYENIEIILINDGSKDNTEKIITEKFGKNKKIIYLSQENKGVSASRNEGIRRATGDYIFFIDADDTLDNGVLLDLVNHLENDRLVGVLHKVKNENKENLVYYSKSNYTKEELINNIIIGNIMGVLWGYLLDTRTVKNILCDINTGYLEDMIFMVEYLLKASINKVTFVDNGNYYNYMINNTGITGSQNNILEKCKQIMYSLNKVDEITKKQYNEILENRKIELLEKQLRLIEQKKLYNVIRENIQIEKYTGKSLRVKIFSYLYREKKITMIHYYYKIRRQVKRIIKGEYKEGKNEKRRSS